MSDPDPAFELLLAHVRDARGFDYSGYRRPTLVRRFKRRLQAVGAADWEAYREYLDQHPDEYASLFDTILINVTGFFRDRETWDAVASGVIPTLLEQRDESAPIRVWSAGCASGEEPYTVAMLLAEALGEDEFRRRAKIYATDVDDAALAEARDAAYTPKQLEKVSPELRERYFQPTAHGLAFRSDLRRNVIFGRNDLHRDPPISRVDLLVSRNTLMYFDPEVQERILGNFAFALRRGGFLVAGKAEALQSGRRHFAAFDLKRRIFVKDGSVTAPFRLPRTLPAAPPEDPKQNIRQAAFEHAPVAQLVVDADGTVAAVNRAARSLFGVKIRDVGRPLSELELSYRPLDLRSALDEVRSKRHVVSRKDVHIGQGEERVTIDVQVAPLLSPGDDYAGAIVSFVDATAHRALEGDLEHARRELETAYEELQSTVEELETTNEELQSTNEELETTNEELQSTNEELETLNEELQSTNEELETMNDELRERTDETLHANAFLGAVLSGIRQGVVVVDPDLRVVAWSRQASELWGLRADEAEGEHLLNLDIGLPVDRLREPVRRLLTAGEEPELELEGHDRRGRRVRVVVSFAPLAAGAAAGDRPGAILLVSAERAD